MYPFDPHSPIAAQQQTHARVLIDRAYLAHYAPGNLGAADNDYFVESTNMKLGAYTLAHNSMPGGVARNITVTQTAAGAEDTNGTITVTGTDLAGAVISEDLVPNAGETVQGSKAFKTVTSIVGAGWAIGEGNDTIVAGFGDKIGLPDRLPENTVLLAALNHVREAVAPTVAVSATDLSSNTVDLSSALDGSPVDIYYIV